MTNRNVMGFSFGKTINFCSCVWFAPKKVQTGSGAPHPFFVLSPLAYTIAPVALWLHTFQVRSSQSLWPRFKAFEVNTGIQIVWVAISVDEHVVFQVLIQYLDYITQRVKDSTSKSLTRKIASCLAGSGLLSNWSEYCALWEYQRYTS